MYMMSVYQLSYCASTHFPDSMFGETTLEGPFITADIQINEVCIYVWPNWNNVNNFNL